ncbi:MAG: hypothetical protein IT193_01225, partial [Propionibacteriaceae bacterium]|nr:hypothetical protein [Propionibacteriaceae bacterium]
MNELRAVILDLATLSAGSSEEGQPEVSRLVAEAGSAGLLAAPLGSEGLPATAARAGVPAGLCAVVT